MFYGYILINEADRNIYHSHGWPDVGKPYRIAGGIKRPNARILGVITAHGNITLLRRDVSTPTSTKRGTDDPAPKFMKCIEEVLTNMEAYDLPYQ